MANSSVNPFMKASMQNNKVHLYHYLLLLFNLNKYFWYLICLAYDNTVDGDRKCLEYLEENYTTVEHLKINKSKVIRRLLDLEKS